MNKRHLNKLVIDVICLTILLQRKGKYAITQTKIKNSKRMWARKWLQRRNCSRGMTNFIFQEIKYEDPSSFKNFCRMSLNSFNALLQSVEPHIKRQDTVLRESISARSRYLKIIR